MISLIIIAIIVVWFLIGLRHAIKNRNKIKKLGVKYEPIEFVLDILMLDIIYKWIFGEYRDDNDPYNFDNL